MFQELVPLVRASEKVVLTLTMVGETMSVLVVPVIKNPVDAALTTPLALSASPQELDAEFAAAVLNVTTAHQSLVEQAEATTSILAAAKSTQSGKATKALAKAASPGATADDSDDAEESDADQQDAATVSTARADVPPPAASTAGTDLGSLL